MSPPARPLSVLVVEDDPRLREILTSHLDRMGYAVRGAGDAATALQSMEGSAADVVLSDVRMPGMDGRTLLAAVRGRHPSSKVVLMTAFGSVDDAVEAMRAGAYSYVCKPFRVEEIAAVLRNAARELALGREVETLRQAVRARWSADRLVGNAPSIRAVREAAREAAQLTATVLVTGASGTGKELVARAIHFEGPRAGGPFVAVNCAAIPEQLFESTLFGHRRGAFTGAVDSQVGLVEHSSGGTLFLDEVAEIPTSHQAKLLRVLQEGELTPVGGARPVQVDLRVIAATNRDLAALVKRGTFREDLYYRLDVLRIALPSLADRAEDVPALAEHLLLEIGRDQGLAVLGLTEEALSALARHPWPGNVRELRNALERALLSARGRRIDVGDLPAPLRAASSGEVFPPSAAPALRSLAEVEREHIETVLAACHWNRSAAARVLGIDRRTLFTKIRAYGLIGPLRRGPEAEGEDEA
ncbi:MAG TPA: sigma-54 dependent transcriptional regulator [Anaeromyxobacteraceae bacterium]|nr:sigma-54 dependent transcriptional regulator [Anaeromyxobacteraceae bacterium]